MTRETKNAVKVKREAVKAYLSCYKEKLQEKERAERELRDWKQNRYCLSGIQNNISIMGGTVFSTVEKAVEKTESVIAPLYLTHGLYGRKAFRERQL